MSATLDAPAIDTHVPTVDAADAVAESFLLLVPRTRRRTFQIKIARDHGGDREVALQVDGKKVDSAAGKAASTTLDLLPKEWRSRLNAAFNRAGDFARDPRVTVPHPSTDLLRILPKSRQEAFFADWPAVRARFDADVGVFFDAYDSEIVPYAANLLATFFTPEGAAKAAAYHLPPLARLKPAFDVSIKALTFRYEDADDAAEAVRDVAEALRDRIVAAMAGVEERLRSGKVVTGRTFADLRNVLATAKAFGDVLGSDAVKAANTLSIKLDAADEAATLKRPGDSITAAIRTHAAAVGSAIAAVTAALGDDVANAAALARFGAAPRRIV